MPRQFPRRTKAEWAKIASQRIINILRRYRLCNLPQLQSKIAEAGPPSIRAQPLSIKDGLAYLLEQGVVKIPLPKNSAEGISTDFYALKEFSLARYTDRGRRDFILEHWPIYRNASGDKSLCGDILETLVDGAIASSPPLLRVGVAGATFNNYQFDGRRFDNSPPLDHVVYLRDQGLVLGVEDKNWRQWLYPRDQITPALLRKCLRNRHIPVLVTRKLPYFTRIFFKHVGILGFETHFQYFHASLEPKFELIRHKDGIGFADLRFPTEPPKHLVHFFSSVVPTQAASTAATFDSNSELIRAFLSQSISYYEFMSRLGIFPEAEEEQDEGLDDYWEY